MDGRMNQLAFLRADVRVCVRAHVWAAGLFFLLLGNFP